MFFIVFLVLTRFLRNSLCNFFAFPLDNVLSINCCKSLVIKELHGAGRPPRRNSLTLRQLRCQVFFLLFLEQASHGLALAQLLAW